MATTFFDLPLELRNMVYHELWECTPWIEVADKGLENPMYAYHTSACYDMEEQSRMPLWLLTNKQMLNEAVDEFQLTARWNVPLDQEDSFTYEPHVLSPLDARYLRVVFFPHAAMFAGEGPSLSSGILFPTDVCSSLYTLVAQLAAHEAIRELTIQVFLCSDSESDTPDVDISDLALDVLSGAKLNKFTVILTECCSDPIDPSQKSSYETKIAKLGKTFMGSSTRITTKDLATKTVPREIRFTIERC